MERRIFLKAAVGTLFLSACGSNPDHKANHLPALPNINVKDLLRDPLPAAVAAMQYSVVALRPPLNKFGGFQSGIVLDPYHVLTSGHGLRDEGGTFNSSVGCPNNVVIKGRDAAGNTFQASSRKIGSFYHPSEPFPHPDMSLIRTEKYIDNYYSLPRVMISDTPVKNGDPLYFINFQESPQGQIRDPFNADLSRFPAILGGIAFTQFNGDIVVKVGKSYGKIHDSTFREMGSGGPVFNKLGELVGISNVSNSNDGHEAFVQPITKNSLNQLSHILVYNPVVCSN